MEFNKVILEKILEDYNIQYKNVINKIYKVPFEENPEAFIFYELNNVDAFLLSVDKEYTSGGEYFLLIFQGTGQREIYSLITDDYDNLYKYGADTLNFLIDLVRSKYNTGKFIDSILEDHLDRYGWYNYNYNEWYNAVKHMFEYEPASLVKRHGALFSEHINKDAYIYADRAYKYTYTDLDFTDIIQSVNDEDFEYALNESLAAYEHNLYLAATSTAGTALENLLIAIIDKESLEFDYNQGTELGFLTNVLLKGKVINKKMKQRIMNSASLRNLASHANKGRTIREDARSIYQIIYTLSSEVYLP